LDPTAATASPLDPAYGIYFRSKYGIFFGIRIYGIRFDQLRSAPHLHRTINKIRTSIDPTSTST
jgi:hypothetical protein